jgi:5-methylcytosine-specific restriction endonuclease McrBC regulatory subunit McrC
VRGALTAREYELLDLSSLARPTAARDALMAATSHLPEAVFTVDRRGRLRTQGFVGLVHAPGVSVQILPKVPAGSAVADDHDLLRRLLVAAGLVPQRLASSGATEFGDLPLLEVVIRKAARDLVSRLGDFGPPRRYEVVRTESDTVRGSIDLDRLMRQMPPERVLVPIRFSPLQADNPLSRVLLALALHLQRVTRSRLTRRLLEEAESRLATVTPMELSHRLLQDGTPRVGEEPWLDLHQLAEGLFGGRRPNPLVAGPTESSVLVFSLDDIFERLVRRIATHSLGGTPWSLAPRSPRRHFLHDTETDRPRLRLRPDLSFVDGSGHPVLVGDAKYKRIRLTPRGLSLAPEDVYQVSAYMNRFTLSRSLLFMPADDGTRLPGERPWTRRMRLEDSDSFIDVVAVDVPALVSASLSEQARVVAQMRAALKHVLAPDVDDGAHPLAAEAG